MRATFMVTAALLVVAGGLGPARAADTDKEEANKRLVVEFYERVINQRDLAAVDEFIGPRYVQHNPSVADGPDGLKAFMGVLREKFPNARSEIKRVFADGDHVILHVHATREPGTRGFAIVDIFRLENGRIVEHWDVRQEVPASAANDNTMF